MVIRADIIKQGENFSIALKYGKKKQMRDLLGLRDDELEKACALFGYMSLLHKTYSLTCPRGVYVFDLTLGTQISDYECFQGDQIGLMGVNETSGQDVMMVLDIIYEAICSYEEDFKGSKKMKFLVKFPDSRPIYFSQKERQKIAKMLHCTVSS